MLFTLTLFSINRTETGEFGGSCATIPPLPEGLVNIKSKCKYPQPVKGSNAKYPLSAPYAPALALPHTTSYNSIGCEVTCPPPLPGSPLGPFNASNCSAVKSEYLNGSPLSPFGPLSALSWSCVKSEYLNGSPLGPCGPFNLSSCSGVSCALVAY